MLFFKCSVSLSILYFRSVTVSFLMRENCSCSSVFSGCEEVVILLDRGEYDLSLPSEFERDLGMQRSKESSRSLCGL